MSVINFQAISIELQFYYESCTIFSGHVGGVEFDSFFSDLVDAGDAVGTENQAEYL